MRVNSSILPKLVAMATYLEESEKSGLDRQHSCKYLPWGEKSQKLVQEIMRYLVILKKKLDMRGKA